MRSTVTQADLSWLRTFEATTRVVRGILQTGEMNDSPESIGEVRLTAAYFREGADARRWFAGDPQAPMTDDGFQLLSRLIDGGLELMQQALGVKKLDDSAIAAIADDLHQVEASRTIACLNSDRLAALVAFFTLLHSGTEQALAECNPLLFLTTYRVSGAPSGLGTIPPRLDGVRFR